MTAVTARVMYYTLRKKLLNRCGVSTLFQRICSLQIGRWPNIILELLCREFSACRLWWQAHIDTIFFLLECSTLVLYSQLSTSIHDELSRLWMYTSRQIIFTRDHRSGLAIASHQNICSRSASSHFIHHSQEN